MRTITEKTRKLTERWGDRKMGGGKARFPDPNLIFTAKRHWRPTWGFFLLFPGLYVDIEHIAVDNTAGSS